jgi:hypothetical protein
MKYKLRTTILSLAILASLWPGIPVNSIAADAPTLKYTLTDSSDYNYGRSVAYGDINGDGYKDLVVGETGSTGTNSGVLLIYWGTSSSIDTTNTYHNCGDIRAESRMVFSLQ